MVAFGGGVDDGEAVHVGGDDGAGDLGDESFGIDAGAVEDPGVEIGRGFARVAVLNEGGKRDALHLVALFPFAVDGEAVGSGLFGRGFLLFGVGTLFLGIERVEDALGAGLVIGEEEGELDLDRPHGGLQDRFVDLFTRLVAESVFDGQLLMKDGAGDAQLAGGGGDADAVEVKDTGGDLLERLLCLLELDLGRVFGRCGFLCGKRGCEQESEKEKKGGAGGHGRKSCSLERVFDGHLLPQVGARITAKPPVAMEGSQAGELVGAHAERTFDVLRHHDEGLDFIGGLRLEIRLVAKLEDDLQGEIDEGWLNDGGVDVADADELHASLGAREAVCSDDEDVFTFSRINGGFGGSHGEGVVVGENDVELFLQAEGFRSAGGGVFWFPISRSVVDEDDAGFFFQFFLKSCGQLVRGEVVLDAANLHDASGGLGRALLCGFALERFEDGLSGQATDAALIAEDDAGAAFIEHAFIEADDSNAGGFRFNDERCERGRVDGADEDGGGLGGDRGAELVRLLPGAACGVVDGEFTSLLAPDQHGESIALELLERNAGVLKQKDESGGLRGLGDPRWGGGTPNHEWRGGGRRCRLGRWGG